MSALHGGIPRTGESAHDHQGAGRAAPVGAEPVQRPQVGFPADQPCAYRSKLSGSRNGGRGLVVEAGAALDAAGLHALPVEVRGAVEDVRRSRPWPKAALPTRPIPESARP